MSYKITIVICYLQIWCLRLTNMVFIWCKHGVFYRKRAHYPLICESQVDEKLYVICYKIKSQMLNFIEIKGKFKENVRFAW